MRLMTYNIRHGLGNAEPGQGAGTVDLTRTARVIQSQRPDIVAVQEVDRFWSRSGFEDQPARLADLLGMPVRYAANVTLPAEEEGRPARRYGVATFSRFPIIDQCTVPLPVSTGWEPRGMLITRIAAGGELVVINTHFQVGQPGREDEGRAQRAMQAREAPRVAKGTALPTIVMGDLNARPHDPELSALLDPDGGLRDAWRAIGQGTGATIPADADVEPGERIDYILVSRGFTLHVARVVRQAEASFASDHYPVVADVSLPEDV